jgi:hypothetical protein
MTLDGAPALDPAAEASTLLVPTCPVQQIESFLGAGVEAAGDWRLEISTGVRSREYGRRQDGTADGRRRLGQRSS